MANVDARDIFLRQYATELQDLTFNSKPIINTLTMLASENPQAAIGIAEAIERRISMSAPAHKLPALYLLDSIVKNIGLPYTALFAKELPQLYLSAWAANPEVRPSLSKLFNTWHRYFPADVLAKISQGSSDLQNQPHQHASSLHQSLPQASSRGHQYYHQSSTLAAPSSWMPNYAAQNVYSQQQVQTNGAQPSTSTNYASAYTPTYPQPQYSHHSPHTSQMDPLFGQQSGHGTPTYPQTQPQGQLQTGVPDILSQLVSAGLIPAGKQRGAIGAKAGPQAAPVVPPLVFNLSKSKDWHTLALKQLLEGTKATEAKFLDQRLHKKRKLAAGTKSSRLWFVKGTDWLAGTTADAQAAPAFFDEDQQAEETADEEQASMPADPTQPNCGLSGERFETFWDDASNRWRYRDATSLDAEQAEKYGLAEGTLVKVSCLGPIAGSKVGGASETLEAAEGQQAAEEVAAAADAETRKSTLKDSTSTDEAAPDDTAGNVQKSPKKQRVS